MLINAGVVWETPPQRIMCQREVTYLQCWNSISSVAGVGLYSAQINVSSCAINENSQAPRTLMQNSCVGSTSGNVCMSSEISEGENVLCVLQEHHKMFHCKKDERQETKQCWTDPLITNNHTPSLNTYVTNKNKYRSFQSFKECQYGSSGLRSPTFWNWSLNPQNAGLIDLWTLSVMMKAIGPTHFHTHSSHSGPPRNSPSVCGST